MRGWFGCCLVVMEEEKSTLFQYFLTSHLFSLNFYRRCCVVKDIARSYDGEEKKIADVEKNIMTFLLERIFGTK